MMSNSPGRMRRLSRQIFFLMVAVLVMPGQAFAASSGTLGGVVYSLGSDIIEPVTILIVGASFIGGFYLVMQGLLKLKDSFDHHHHGEKGLMPGMKRILGGGALASLPSVLGVGIGSFFSGTGSYSKTLDGSSPGSVSACLTGSTTGDTLTCVAQNVGVNLVPVAVQAIFILSFVTGLLIMGVSIHKLATQASGGHGRPETGKLMMKMGLASVLCALPTLIYSIEQTLGYGSSSFITASGAAFNTSSPPSLLAYSGSSSSSLLTSFNELISWCFVILVLFGILSIVKGLSYLNAQIDGQSRATVGNALTHIVGGVFLANGKLATCFILMTLIGAGEGFCS